ncbi:MAG: hypothetical protein JXR87_07225 [Candidatus Marinimicrobia bacterium]|nr:hypothetical protein [Candidatus Neomarinimicrobiota bacterium]
MKLIFNLSLAVILSLILTTAAFIRCSPDRLSKIAEKPELFRSNIGATGPELTIEFRKGFAYNHPSIAVWLETMDGQFIQTLFVTKYVATGIFGHGELAPGKWKAEPGPAVRPATLPYWLHKRGQKTGIVPDLPSPKNPVPDAISGATPVADFILKTNSSPEIPLKFRLLLEINQTWDANHYWTNNKFPDDPDYFTSLQPALVYAVTIDLESDITEYFLNPAGHSHYSGKDGNLYTDLSTFTTALNIADQIIVHITNR